MHTHLTYTRAQSIVTVGKIVFVSAFGCGSWRLLSERVDVDAWARVGAEDDG